jgi:hypothetical protein
MNTAELASRLVVDKTIATAGFSNVDWTDLAIAGRSLR